MFNRTRLALGTATTAAVVSAVLIPATTASAAPAMTVTPSNSLYNGATVMVGATGLQPNEQVAFAECNTSGSDSSWCDLNHVKVVAADSSGTVSSTAMTIS